MNKLDIPTLDDQVDNPTIRATQLQTWISMLIISGAIIITVINDLLQFS